MARRGASGGKQENAVWDLSTGKERRDRRAQPRFVGPAHAPQRGILLCVQFDTLDKRACEMKGQRPLPMRQAALRGTAFQRTHNPVYRPPLPIASLFVVLFVAGLFHHTSRVQARLRPCSCERHYIGAMKEACSCRRNPCGLARRDH